MSTNRTRTMTEDELRRHAEQTLRLPDGFPAAPDIENGKATDYAINQDSLDGLLGEIIATALARDADTALVSQMADARKTDLQLADARTELSELALHRQDSCRALQAFNDKTRGMEDASRLKRLATPAVLGVIGLAEAALLYPALRYALPAPDARGMLGILLTAAPTCAALAIGLASAVAQKHIGKQLANAHRGVVCDPPAPSTNS